MHVSLETSEEVVKSEGISAERYDHVYTESTY